MVLRRSSSCGRACQSWIINSGADFWGWLGDKFGGGRGTRPLDAMKPSLTEGRFVNYAPTGLTMTAFFAALFFGLVFYTSTFIAEIVRGGILAVPKGQSEAAAALGLSRMQSLRKVVLPQAFRVIMPPLGNQYLNITKNTSLGIAVGFSEIVQVGQTRLQQEQPDVGGVQHLHGLLPRLFADRSRWS